MKLVGSRPASSCVMNATLGKSQVLATQKIYYKLLKIYSNNLEYEQTINYRLICEIKKFVLV